MGDWDNAGRGRGGPGSGDCLWRFSPRANDDLVNDAGDFLPVEVIFGTRPANLSSVKTNEKSPLRVVAVGRRFPQ